LNTLISSNAAATRLGVSRATVWRAVARGLLAPALVTPGGQRRFAPADVEALAASLERDGHGPNLLSTGEAARMLGISQPTLNRAVRSGRLKAARVTPGGHRRFYRFELTTSLAFTLEEVAS
jgi:excisionase family DNA binding protein